MKTYKVWIEVEEYDDTTEEGATVDGALGFASTAEFKTLDEAIRFGERLNATGQNITEERRNMTRIKVLLFAIAIDVALWIWALSAD